jgi:hypothetical protein
MGVFVRQRVRGLVGYDATLTWWRSPVQIWPDPFYERARRKAPRFLGERACRACAASELFWQVVLARPAIWFSWDFQRRRYRTRLAGPAAHCHGNVQIVCVAGDSVLLAEVVGLVEVRELSCEFTITTRSNEWART